MAVDMTEGRKVGRVAAVLVTRLIVCSSESTVFELAMNASNEQRIGNDERKLRDSNEHVSSSRVTHSIRWYRAQIPFNRLLSA